MAEEYKGFNIPDKIIIVSKDVYEYDYEKHERVLTDKKQGYVVIPGNKSTLESALNWADVKYDFVNDERVYQDYDKHVHEYENGKFSVRIVDSANSSSQGGKLSFWTCELAIGQDKYLIGINADLLCDFIIGNKLDNGCCDNVYLGRQKTRVGIFTEGMQTFKQAKQDAITRTKKASVKYNIGQKLFSKSNYHCVYLGELYQVCEHFHCRSSRYEPTKQYIVVYDKPKKVHAYASFKEIYKNGEHIYNFTKLEYASVSDKKMPYYFDEGDMFDVKPTYEEYCRLKDQRVNSDIDWIKKYHDDRPGDKAEARINSTLAQAAFDKICYRETDERLIVNEPVKNIFNNYLRSYLSHMYGNLSEYEIISEDEMAELKEKEYKY